MLGYSEVEIQRNPNEWFDRVHQDDLEKLKMEISHHIQRQTSHFTNEHRLQHKDGSYRWALCRGMAVWKNDDDESHNAVRLAGSISDITDRKIAEDRLLHDALHDALTGLPNLVLFTDRLNQTIERSKRHEDYQYAVFFLDLDNFKDINDSIGHIVGDQFLIKVGEILKSRLRATDTIARFGGDEFIILLDDIKDTAGLNRLIDELLEQFNQVIKIENHKLKTSVSIGVVLSDSHEKNAEEIIRNADIAMYAAKAKGKARAEIFEPSLRLQFLEKLNLEVDLNNAIENNEFVIHYQPIVVLEDQSLVGFEALIRWQHPQKGLLYPGDFIALAEETNLIIDIGNWVLGEACRQMAAWNKQYDDGLTISINISGKHIADPDLYNYIHIMLGETGLAPKNLKLEITELTIVDQSEFTVRALSKLRDLGVQLQIDDFGIGYSSLGYLSSFPINALKIDQSFIEKIVEDNSQRDIVQAIISLTERLNVKVIAEGVETYDQLNELRQLGCELGQGYLLSTPMDIRDCEELLGQISQGTGKLPSLETDS